MAEGLIKEEVFTEKQKIEAAYALNLCTVSLTQIVDYSDPYVLEQEYDAILNNLNIQNIIHDESLLKLIKKIMETLTFYRIQEGDKKYLEQEYQGKMKSAIWSAVPSLSVILAGGNPVTAAAAVATQVGIGYMNYRKTKGQDLREKEKKEWELKRALIDEISGLQRELFETAWRLSDRYDFDDKYRLTEKQIKAYSAILMDGDPLRRYERLDTQNDIFQVFPPFWYYKGNAAQEIARKYAKVPAIAETYRAKALEDYRKFDSIYIELMREDVIAASCAMEHIALLDKTKDTEEIKRLLDRAIRFAGDNFDVLQLAVLNWLSLGENDRAKAVLRRLVNENYNIGLNGLLLSRIYCKWDKNKTEFAILQDRVGKRNVIPWVEDDSEADKKYIESREDAVSRCFGKFLDAFGLKYQNRFNDAIAYDKSLRLRKQVDWCLGIDITQSLVNTSNEMFRELLKNELFVLQKRPENKPWDDFFISQSTGLSDKIQKFNATQEKVKNAVLEIMERNPFGIMENMSAIGDSANKAMETAGKAFDSLNKAVDGKLGFLKTGVNAIGTAAGKAVDSAGKALEAKTNIVQNISGNEAEQEKLKSAVKVLLQACDFSKYSSDFFAAVKDEFKKSLTVESVVSLQENMMLVINRWYRENGFELESAASDDMEIDVRYAEKDREFFQYPV
jgi:hypothetical protein